MWFYKALVSVIVVVGLLVGITDRPADSTRAAGDTAVTEGSELIEVQVVHDRCGHASTQHIDPQGYSTLVCPHCNHLFMVSPGAARNVYSPTSGTDGDH